MIKSYQKKALTFIGLFTLFIFSLNIYANCKPVYIERPKMEWYLDECGQWHQGYPDDDDTNKKTSETQYEKFSNYD